MIKKITANYWNSEDCKIFCKISLIHWQVKKKSSTASHRWHIKIETGGQKWQNRLILRNESATVLKDLGTRKIQGPEEFITEHHFKDEPEPVLLKLRQRIEKKETFSNPGYKSSIALQPMLANDKAPKKTVDQLP